MPTIDINIRANGATRGGAEAKQAFDSVAAAAKKSEDAAKSAQAGYANLGKTASSAAQQSTSAFRNIESSVGSLIGRIVASDAPDDVVKNWMRNRELIEFLGLWEQLNNPDFKPVEFDVFRKSAGRNAFVLSPKKWIDATGATGIQSKSGRYGGTFAHVDIAMEFASWISPEFKLYIIKDYQRLKSDEGHRLSLECQARACQSQLPYPHERNQRSLAAAVSDTAANQFHLRQRSRHAEHGAIRHGRKAVAHTVPGRLRKFRDHADIYQLIVLVNLKSMNAELIKQGLARKDRLTYLNRMAVEQVRSLMDSTAVQRLSEALGNPPAGIIE
ncbi:MAG: KilA-N domain-containing protein [Desulfovibrio sp.]|jgi:hypothetical protein|nr:KilA-N domain-containing protein [Desulfovibrio sp.]